MENVEDIYVLTPSQEGILYHSITESREDLYVEQLVCQFHGELDSERMMEAWKNVIQRHSALRTVFLWEDIDEPLQVVRKTAELDWVEHDWCLIDEDDFTTRWETLLREDRERGFTISQTPPSRMQLVRISNDRSHFLWTFHHLLLDGWSTAALIREVMDHYSGNEIAAVSTSDRITVKEFLAWNATQDELTGTAFWREQLKGCRVPSRISFRDVPVGKGTSQRLDFLTSETLYQELSAVARDNRLTISTLVHAAWAILLGKYCDQDDVIFGSTISGRPADLKSSETIIGCLIKTLPLRVRIESGQALKDWLTALQDQHVAIRESAPLSLAKMQPLADFSGRTPLFDTVVVFENYPDALCDGERNGLTLSGFDIIEQSHYSFALLAMPERDSIRFRLIQKNGLDTEVLRRIATHFENTLRWIVTHVDENVGAAEILDAKESKQLVRWGTGPTVGSRSASTVLDLLDTDEEKLAIVHGNERISYKEFHELVEAFAVRLVEAGVSVGDRVGICLDRSVELIVALFATLKAGAAYVPMDPGYPRARLEFITEDAGCKVVVASGASVDLFPSQMVVDINAGAAFEKAGLPVVNHGDIAYVIYTSGSTGTPKGVPISHGNLLSSTLARLDHYEEPPKRFLLLSSISFDSSVAGIFWTLAGGGALVLPGAGQEKDLAEIETLIRDHEVSHTLCLPSLYDLLLQSCSGDALESLEVVVVAGEECHPLLVRKHQEALSSCNLYNEYGPTESTVWATAHRCQGGAQRSRVPIGKPIPGALVRVVDSSGKMVPVGVPGEMMLGGPGLALGYWRNAMETERRFGYWDPTIQEKLYRTGDVGYWSSDGELFFVGRSDSQVKVRGHRIELGEIENALLEIDGVSEAVVMTETQLVSNDIDSLAAAMRNLSAPEVAQLLDEVERS